MKKLMHTFGERATFTLALVVACTSLVGLVLHQNKYYDAAGLAGIILFAYGVYRGGVRQIFDKEEANYMGFTKYVFSIGGIIVVVTSIISTLRSL